jgi:hypothetical protein
MHDAPRQERWTAIRDAIEPPLLGKVLLDFGCHEGAFVGAAAKAGMTAYGVDRDETALVLARARWGLLGAHFLCKDIVDLDNFQMLHADVALLLSTWAYIVRDRGAFTGELLIHDLLASIPVLFFETQLWGDGPGPAFLKTDDDVRRMLERYGELQPIITLPVAGREAFRTVWKVSSTPSV